MERIVKGVLASIATTDPMSYFEANNLLNYAGSTFRSLYDLMMTIGVSGVAITLVIALIQLGRKDSRKREEAKGAIFMKLLVLFLMFHAVGWLGWLLKVSQSLG